MIVDKIFRNIFLKYLFLNETAIKFAQQTFAQKYALNNYD